MGFSLKKTIKKVTKAHKKVIEKSTKGLAKLDPIGAAATRIVTGQGLKDSLGKLKSDTAVGSSFQTLNDPLDLFKFRANKAKEERHEESMQFDEEQATIASDAAREAARAAALALSASAERDRLAAEADVSGVEETPEVNLVDANRSSARQRRRRFRTTTGSSGVSKAGSSIRL